MLGNCGEIFRYAVQSGKAERNLVDETTFNLGNDATLSGLGFGFEFAYFHIIEAPRTLELQLRLNF